MVVVVRLPSCGGAVSFTVISSVSLSLCLSLSLVAPQLSLLVVFGWCGSLSGKSGMGEFSVEGKRKEIEEEVGR